MRAPTSLQIARFSVAKLTACRATLSIAIALLIVLGCGSPAAAQSADTLAQRAEKQLSNAQRSMFAGNKDAATEALLKAAQDLEQLRQAAPDNAKLTTLDSKAANLKRDLERRTNKTIDLKAGTAVEKQTPEAPADIPPPRAPTPAPGREAAAPAPPSGAAAAAGQRMPAPVQQAMRELESKFRSIEECYRWVDTYRERAEDPTKMAAKLKSVGAIIPELQPALEAAKQEAAKRGVTGHPDFDAAQKHIDAQPPRLEQALADVTLQATAAASGKAEVAADVGALGERYDRLREKFFDKAPGVAIYFNDWEPVDDLIARIEGFEKLEQAAATEALAKFAAKYGQTAEAIDRKADSMGYAGDRRAGYAYEQLRQGIEIVAKTRTAMAEELARRAEDRLGNLATRHDFFRLQEHGEVRRLLKMAKRFEAANPRVRDLSVAAEKRMADDLKLLVAKIDGVKWPGSVGGLRKEESAALRYFRESVDWEKRPTEPRHVLGVAIRGEWTVQKRNILSEPVMFGVPALVAVQVDGEKRDNLARVYNVTLRNAEGAKAKPEPPFVDITVGDSWYIRPDAVK